MKYCYFFLLIFYEINSYKFNSACKSDKPFTPAFCISQQEPFYFNKPLPARIQILEKVDLSFFKNPLIISYRYKLEIPDEGETLIDKKILIWSVWTGNDFADIVVPRLDLDGSYKLIIEYKRRGSSDIKKLEKLFFVYKAGPATKPVVPKSQTAFVTNKVVTNTASEAGKTSVVTTPAVKKIMEQSTSVTEKTVVKPTPVTDETITKKIPDVDNRARPKEPVRDKKLDLNEVLIKDEISQNTIPQTGTIPAGIDKVINPPDYEKLLFEAIERKDSVLFSLSIRNGAGVALRGENGKSIFNLLDDAIVSEELISLLKKKGFLINKTDNYGNSPLHYAILKGKNDYASFLVDQGADLNIKNKKGLSPLHLAVFLNNEKIVNRLLIKGAEVNLKGNTGYTPLHIAVEMNRLNILRDLLSKGANEGSKTDQKLSSRNIARIQNNHEIINLLLKKDTHALNPPKPSSIISFPDFNIDKQIPAIDFNLPYNAELVRRRQFNKVVQTISIPVFALSVTVAARLKSEANHYYSLSKIAETEETARIYYDKTTRFDKLAYIPGGISLISVYGFIQSTLKKKSISKKMSKTFNLK